MAFGAAVQTNTGNSSSATVTPTLPGSTTLGNLIVLQFGADDYNGTVSTGWTQSTGMEQQGYLGSYIWWAKATTGMTIPNYVIASASRSVWTLVEYEGPFDASPYDVSAGQFSNSGPNSYTTPTCTPTTGDRLLVAGMFFHRASTSGPGTIGTWLNSFNEIIEINYSGTNPSYSIAQATRLVTGNGSTTYSSGATVAGPDNGVGGLIISFKKGAAATSIPNQVIAPKQGLVRAAYW